MLKTAADTSRILIKKCNPLVSDCDPQCTNKEQYAINAFMSLSNVVLCIDQLYYSVELLTGYRSHSSPEKMNRYDYIIFGVENYYLRLTSIYDRCLRLANEIFQLGLPEKECRESTIIKNEHIKGTPVAKSLKSLDSFTQPFRAYRNTIAHKSTYSEHELDKLGIYYLVTEEDDQLTKYFYYYKTETDKYIKDSTFPPKIKPEP